MTLDLLASIAEITGVILVIASLIYVARQLRQNSEMMRAESRNSIQSSKQQELFAIVEHPEIWRGFTGVDLDDENIRLSAWLVASLRGREHEWFQFRYGVLEEKAWRSYATAIPIVLAGERARTWWVGMKPAFDKEFVKIVDESLGNEELNATANKQAAALSQAAGR